jgi:hypothetical protein
MKELRVFCYVASHNLTLLQPTMHALLLSALQLQQVLGISQVSLPPSCCYAAGSRVALLTSVLSQRLVQQPALQARQLMRTHPRRPVARRRSKLACSSLDDICACLEGYRCRVDLLLLDFQHFDSTSWDSQLSCRVESAGTTRNIEAAVLLMLACFVTDYC